MKGRGSSWLASQRIRVWLLLAGFLAVFVAVPLCAGTSLAYTESKGPFKNWSHLADLDGDGDLDVLVSHTRWEDIDISWAGVARWLNQGDGTFEQRQELSALTGHPQFGGYAAATGDADGDGDQDVFKQDFDVHLLVNQGGRQAGETGRFETSGRVNAPPAYAHGYRDMGGTITLADLNGDGRLDAFIASCCYGLEPTRRGRDFLYAPAFAWVWLNDGLSGGVQSGHNLALEALDGRPIRQAAAGDLDGDGDLDIWAAVGRATLGRSPSLSDLVLLNDGAGNLTLAEPLPAEFDSTAVALGDVNGDGRLDALTGTDDGAVLWLNQGSDGQARFAAADQAFAAERTGKQSVQAGFAAVADGLWGLYLPWGSVRSRAVFLEDLDGDGDLDAVLARLWWAEIWWNDGRGRFTGDEARFAYDEDTGVAVADFDGDGWPDIFAASHGREYRVWWNDGTGGWR
jgi:hypothetical protein